MTHIDSFRANISFSTALTATRYSFILKTTQLKEVGFEFGCVGTGSPVGTWSWEGSNDPSAEADFWTEQSSGTPIGASNTGKFFALATPTAIMGDALAITGSSATKTDVEFVLGLPAYLRMKFTYTSGGSASSTAYVYAHGRQ